MFQKMPVSSLPSQLSMPNRGCNDCTAVILSCMRSNQYFLPEAAAACRSASSLMGSPHCMASCLKACRYVSSVMSIRHLVPAMNAQAGSSREPCDEKTTPEHQGAISVLIIDKSQIREDFIGDLVDSVLASRMQQAQQTRPHRCRRLLPRDRRLLLTLATSMHAWQRQCTAPQHSAVIPLQGTDTMFPRFARTALPATGRRGRGGDTTVSGTGEAALTRRRRMGLSGFGRSAEAGRTRSGSWPTTTAVEGAGGPSPGAPWPPPPDTSADAPPPTADEAAGGSSFPSEPRGRFALAGFNPPPAAPIPPADQDTQHAL